MFRIGQRVVCIKHDPINVADGKSYPAPQEGEIVTILNFNSKGLLYLKEYSKEFETPWGYYDNIVFEPWNFKPLELDYNFVEEVIKQVQPQKETA